MNSSWLSLTRENGHTLVDHDRLEHLASTLPNPETQYPILISFIGSRSSRNAVPQLLPGVRMRKGGLNDCATVEVDENTRRSRYPRFVAELNAHSSIPHTTEQHQRAEKQDISSFSGKDNSPRFLLPFSDIVCIFADKFSGFNEVVNPFEAWAPVSTQHRAQNPIRSEIVIVTCGEYFGQGPTYDALALDNLRERSSGAYNSIAIVPVYTYRIEKQKKPLVQLTETVRRRRENEGFLFSAKHLAPFFRMSVAHKAANIRQPFDFLFASGRDNEASQQQSIHVRSFMQKGVDSGTVMEDLSAFVAMVLVVDAYPPRMHGMYTLHKTGSPLTNRGFPPEPVFRNLYQQSCLLALRALDVLSGTENNWVRFIGQKMEEIVAKMKTQKQTANDLFGPYIANLSI